MDDISNTVNIKIGTYIFVGGGPQPLVVYIVVSNKPPSVMQITIVSFPEYVVTNPDMVVTIRRKSIRPKPENAHPNSLRANILSMFPTLSSIL